MLDKHDVVLMVKKTLEYYLGKKGASVYVRGDRVYLEYAGLVVEFRVEDKDGLLAICPYVAGKRCYICMGVEEEEVVNISLGLAEACGVPLV